MVNVGQDTVGQSARRLAHAARAAALLEQFGFAVERHAVPKEAVAANGMMSCVNLIVRKRFGPGPVIACNAHGDVVPPGAGWSADPYGAEVRDGRMYGREFGARFLYDLLSAQA